MLHVASLLLLGAAVGHTHSHGHEDHHCIHDDLELNIEKIDESEREGNTLSDGFEGIRIQTVFADDNVCSQSGVGGKKCWCTQVGESIPSMNSDIGDVTCTSEDVVDAQRKQYIQGVLDEAVAWITAAFKVKRITGSLKLTKSSNVCGPSQHGVVIPGPHRSPGVTGVDLVIYVAAVPVKVLQDGTIGDGNTVAWAVPCLEEGEGRPVAGMVNFNPRWFQPTETHTRKHKSGVEVTIHEIFHILGFSSHYMTNFGSWFGGVSPLGTSGEITSTNVVAQARQHFGCNTLSGAGIEQQGGSGTKGSHWEKRIFGDESMTGQVTNGVTNPVSTMTLAYFKDTGVYDVDYAKAGNFAWGKNKGCAFANAADTLACSKNKNWGEYCWNDDQGNELTKATMNQPCYGGVSPCNPFTCAYSLESMGQCNLKAYTSSLSAEFQQFSDPTIGGLSLADHCPTVVVPNSFSNLDTANGLYFGTCVEDVPAECTPLSQADCSSNRYPHCSWDNGKCISTILEYYGSSYGSTARCFVTTGFLSERLVPNSHVQPRCYRVHCNPSASTYTIEVSTGQTTTTTVNCGSGGSAVTPTGFRGSITCWPYAEVCTGRGNVLETQIAEATPQPTLVPGTTWAPPTPAPTAEPANQPTSAPTACSQRMIAQQADCMTFRSEATCLPSCMWCKTGEFSSECLYTGEACGALNVGTVTLNYHTANQCPTVSTPSEGSSAILPSVAVLLLALLC